MGFAGSLDAAMDEDYGVAIEDEWEVDEYDVTMLSAAQSTGLLAFLRERGLELPERAAPALRAYIETGHRFVLLRADPRRAQHVGERMVLSPVQLDLESERLSVPVRLGTLNSPGEQELLLYVFSNDGRYELANRPNVSAPTDLRVRDDYDGGFARFYAGLVDAVLREHPGAAMTEYARSLGQQVAIRHVWAFGLDRVTTREERQSWREMRRWTLTRVRHRYGTELDDDLLFRVAHEPLRMTRRWDDWSLWDRAPRGRDAFRVRMVVEHEAAPSCPSFGQRRSVSSRWASAEELWDGSAPLWPGDVLLDDVPELGIEAGSSAPEGWGAIEPEHSPDAAVAEAAVELERSEATEAPVEATTGEPLAAQTHTGCAVRQAGTPWPGVALVLGLLGLVVRSRRR
jgi:MYXO-CTERM domain-containing protein